MLKLENYVEICRRMTLDSEKLREVFLYSQKQRSEALSKVKPFVEHFCKNDTVLEIGCGRGVELSVVSDFCGYSVGMDIDEDVLKMAKERLREKLNVDLVRGDTRLLPFRPKCISKILCFDVLEHLISPAKIISDLRCLLISHGEVILRVPNKWTSH